MADNRVFGTVEPDLARPGYFDFSLNGIATARQMERLIELTATLAKRTADKNTAEGKAAVKRIEALEKDTVQTRRNTKQNQELGDATRDLADDFSLLERAATGGIRGISDFSYFLGRNKPLAIGLAAFGTTLGALNGYADSLGKAMQIGVAGDVMTFAIASKTAGLKLESFTKALGETGGGFASLGTNATDGAMRFGGLVEEVRKSTYQFGNLGLSIDDLAVFTAQQVKVAVSQGFKGKQAQEQVRKNSVALAKELASLSESTGKSVTELAAAANKLATDPLIATMVATTRESREQVSKAVASFGASIRGVFGEAGDVLGTDALKSAAAGLPLAMTDAGKNLLIASTPLYNEFTRLAQGVQQGREVTEEDRDRLRKIAEQEVQTRGQQIKTMSMLEGPAGDAARQILKLAEEARFYNTEEGKERKKQLDAARKFVAERNRLEANLQQALLPLIEVLNSVNWNLFYGVLNGFAVTLQAVLSVLNPVANVLGATGAGSLIGGLLALTGIVGVTVGALRALFGVIGAARSIAGAGLSGGAGGLAGVFGRRANGQSATTPLWVRAVDSLTGRVPTVASANRGIPGPKPPGSDRMSRTTKMGMLGLGGLFAGGLLGTVGQSMGGEAGGLMELLGAGLDIGSAVALYKTYGPKAAYSIGKALTDRGIASSKLAGFKMGKGIVAAGAGAVVAGTVANATIGKAETNAGTLGNIGGSVAGALAAPAAGAAAGRLLGAGMGAFLGGPVGIMLFSTLGGVVGQIVGDKLFGDEIKDTAADANEQVQSQQAQQASETANMSSKISELIDYQRASNSINAQALTYQRDTSRGIRNLPMPS